MPFSKIVRNQLLVYSYLFKKQLDRRKVALNEVSAKNINLLGNVSSVPVSIYFEEDNLKRIPEKIPGQIKDIQYWGDRSRKIVSKQLGKKSINLDKSVFYELEDVLITNHSLYCGKYRRALDRNHYKDFVLPVNYRECEYAVFAHNYFSLRYWGHWLMSELPMQNQLKYEGPFIGNSGRKTYRDESFWRSLLELPVIQKSEVWRVDRLLFGNPKAMDPVTIKNWFAIRDKIRVKNGETKKVYIKRGQAGQSRFLVNEDALIVALEKMDFEIIDITKTVGDILINSLSNIDIVIGVEGSHMDPAMYTIRDGGILIILQPPGRVSLNTVTNSSICGVCSSIYICDFESDYFKFRIDVDKFLSFFDRASKWSENNSYQIIDKARGLEHNLMN